MASVTQVVTVAGVLAIAYFLGSWNFSFVYLVGLAAVLIHAEFRAQERVTAVKAVQCMRDTRILKKVVDELPSWVFVSDYERVEWLNKAVHKLWPFIKKATAESITSSLHPIFDSARPPFLTKLRFEQLDLGTTPLVATGVKSFTAAADEITIDIEFKFAGNPQVVLGVAVAGVPIPIEVKHLECYGTIRLQLKPLIPVWPCFGAISIAFTRKPTITFSLQVLKGNVMDVPGLNNWLDTFLKETLALYFVWPMKIVVPIVDHIDVNVEELQKAEIKGTLIVHVREAKGLKNTDIIGKSDPYVVLCILDQRKQTRVIDDNLDPVFDETFDFDIVDPTTQQLKLEVFDKDRMSSTLLGDALVDIDMLEANAPREIWVPLHNGTGQVALTLTWRPKNIDSAVVATPKMIQQGVLFVHLINGRNLVKMDRFGESDPYAIFKLGITEQKSSVKPKTLNPDWDEEFNFKVSDAEMERLRIDLMDQNKMQSDEPMGWIEIRVADVAKTGRVSQTWQLNGVERGEITMNLEFRKRINTSDTI